MDTATRTKPRFGHIYDPQRVELALTLLDKEFRKLFLGLPEDSWQAVNKSMRGWVERPEDYHFSGEQLRDFWDSFAAVLESIKLKPNFVAWVTAENAQWQRATIAVRDIKVTHMLKQLESIPGLAFRPHIPMTELLEALAKHPSAAAEQKRLVDRHSTDPKQDDYPIIVRKVAEHDYVIIDGNRRTLRAALYGKEAIDAWTVELTGAKPTNFWIPLNDMLQLVKLFKRASVDANERSQQAVALLLHDYFRESPLAEYLYRIRIGACDAAAQRLYELALQC